MSSTIHANGPGGCAERWAIRMRVQEVRKRRARRLAHRHRRVQLELARARNIAGLEGPIERIAADSAAPDALRASALEAQSTSMGLDPLTALPFGEHARAIACVVSPSPGSLMREIES